MPQENVELVRRLFPPDGTDLVPLVRDKATWTTRFGEMGALVESDYAVAWIAEGQRMIEATGEADSRRGWLDWLEPWDTYRFQNEGIIPVGDTVLVLLRVHGRMAGTQNEVEMISASVYLVRDGRVARVEHYADRAAALEAVGLSEQDAHADT